jgi:radical SAM superfamily enzyme YgiQ (UPF0313 family)
MKIIFPVMGAENISVSYLSTALKNRGYTVKVAFDRALFDDKQYFSVQLLNKIFTQKKRVINEIIKEKPNVLAISVFADNYQWCLDVVREVKKEHQCISVWGGIHATSCPEEVISRDEVDFMIVGEGEKPLLELLESIEKNNSPRNIKNLWYRKDGYIIKNPPRALLNPDEFPDIDKKIYETFIPIKKYYMTVTGKGCIGHCSYCSQNFLKKWENSYKIGKFIREKSVSKVIGELIEMKKTYGIQYVDIKNNILSGSKKWLNEFLNRYPKEVGLPFRIMGHPMMFKDDFAIKLKKAGCNHIQMGVESFNPKVRSEILLRNETNEQIVRALDSIEQTGINFSVDLIVGLPGESEKDLEIALKTLCNYRKLIRASIFWLQYLPNVAITHMALKDGYINENNMIAINKGLQKNYLSTGSPMEKRREQILKTYHILFRLLPVLPGRMIKFIIETNKHRILRYIPFQIVWIIAIDVFVSYFRKDYYAKWIMSWYAKQIIKHISGRSVTISD